MKRSPVPTFIVGAFLTVFVSGCTSPVALDAAPDAQNALCAEATVRLPPVVIDLGLRETNAQSTGAWGNPAEVLFRCGVEPPGPTTDVCREFEGIDWVVDDSGDVYVVATTYGRDPAIEVVMNRDIIAPGEILAELADTAAVIPAESNCI